MMDFHHAHLFCRDIAITLDWWQRHMAARVLYDGVLAGARNVFIAVGSGRLHLYDQAPRDAGRGGIHHLGIRVRDLAQVWPRLQAAGVKSQSGLRTFDGWRYVMVSAPDNVLLELFEFDDPDAPVNRPLG